MKSFLSAIALPLLVLAVTSATSCGTLSAPDVTVSVECSEPSAVNGGASLLVDVVPLGPAYGNVDTPTAEDWFQDRFNRLSQAATWRVDRDWIRPSGTRLYGATIDGEDNRLVLSHTADDQLHAIAVFANYQQEGKANYSRILITRGMLSTDSDWIIEVGRARLAYRPEE